MDGAVLIKICKEGAGPERKGERKGASSASKSPGAAAPARTYRLPPTPGRPRRAQLYQVGLNLGLRETWAGLRGGAQQRQGRLQAKAA